MRNPEKLGFFRSGLRLGFRGVYPDVRNPSNQAKQHPLTGFTKVYVLGLLKN